MSLVLTDIRMPNIYGFALPTKLRSQFPDFTARAVSGYVYVPEIGKHEFDGFTDKPVSLKHLRSVMEEVVHKDQ